MVWRPNGKVGADADVAGDAVAGSGLSGTGYAAGQGYSALTLAQNIPGITGGAVVVTTPQDIANRRQKGIVMFEKVEVPVNRHCGKYEVCYIWRQLRIAKTDLRHGRRGGGKNTIL